MRLKARWSCLRKRVEMKLQDLPVVLGACCVLHNICEMRNEELGSKMRFQMFNDEVVPENCMRSINAMHVRDKIAHKLLHHNPVYMSPLGNKPHWSYCESHRHRHPHGLLILL
ncbi:hypothetical protein PHJA_000006100 [Phtheirospermum japonicum]|uniref:DDE Tnp4 domain-containing protein n=1 Tax=Phtheirospermum japonicum TaxID=374723 RepID=A0A830B2Y1_9LAMI|nr:hypothetical protein PHJA_000006100 [Phtheirospermum japonicum]